MANELTTTSANGTPQVTLSPLDGLTLAQTAAYLQLPEDDVRAEAAAGRLIGQNIRGEWRFVRDEIVAWLRMPRRKLQSSVAGILAHETDEEYAAYWANSLAYRDELDRATGSGKYAPE